MDKRKKPYSLNHTHAGMIFVKRGDINNLRCIKY